MTRTERIFHMVLFEVIALVILTLVAVLTTGNHTLSMGGLVLTLSAIAMIWNYFYNWAFDKAVKGERIKRSKRTRLIHGIGFEVGMILLSFPVIMWALSLNFLSVLLMDFGFVSFFFVYAIIFNWLYDLASNNFKKLKGEAL